MSVCVFVCLSAYLGQTSWYFFLPICMVHFIITASVLGGEKNHPPHLSSQGGGGGGGGLLIVGSFKLQLWGARSDPFGVFSNFDCVYGIYEEFSRGIFFCSAQFRFLGLGEGVKYRGTICFAVFCNKKNWLLGTLEKIENVWFFLCLFCELSKKIFLTPWPPLCSIETEMKLSTVRWACYYFKLWFNMNYQTNIHLSATCLYKLCTIPIIVRHEDPNHRDTDNHVICEGVYKLFCWCYYHYGGGHYSWKIWNVLEVLVLVFFNFFIS